MVVPLRSTNRLFQKYGVREEIESERRSERIQVIKTCANPACAAPFLYWRGGRLFRFEMKAPYDPCLDVAEHNRERKPSRRSVFFWLCENCCSTMVLRFDQRRGVAVVPLRSMKRDGSLTGPKDVRKFNAAPLTSREQTASIGIANDRTEGTR